MLQEIGKTHCCRRDHLTASVVFVECLNSLDTRGVFVKKAAFAYPFALTANRRGFKSVFVSNPMFFRISCADDNVLFHVFLLCDLMMWTNRVDKMWTKTETKQKDSRKKIRES